MSIGDWSSDVCSSDLFRELDAQFRPSGFKAMMGAEAIKELLKRVQIGRASCRERVSIDV